MVIEAIIGQVVNFTDTSTNIDATATYEWQFGDGQSATTKNTSHSYSTKGLYNVVHTVKNSCNTIASECGLNQVNVIYPICKWITDNGGVYPFQIANVSALKSAYLGFAPILGLTVTISHISGAKSYYLNIISSGNSLTGCDF